MSGAEQAWAMPDALHLACAEARNGQTCAAVRALEDIAAHCAAP